MKWLTHRDEWQRDLAHSTFKQQTASIISTHWTSHHCSLTPLSNTIPYLCGSLCCFLRTDSSHVLQTLKAARSPVYQGVYRWGELPVFVCYNRVFKVSFLILIYIRWFIFIFLTFYSVWAGVTHGSLGGLAPPGCVQCPGRALLLRLYLSNHLPLQRTLLPV